MALLLHACSQHADLPIFQTGATDGASILDAGLDAESVFPYPKAGNGTPLPHELNCLSILLDDDAETFSHRWEEKAEGVNLGPMSAPSASQRLISA